MTEQPTPYDAVAGFEKVKAEMERVMTETYVGHPTFMAFSDLVDLEAAEIAQVRAESGNVHFVGNDRHRMKVVLVEDRIQRRSSEIPEYFKHHKMLKGIVNNFMQEPANRKPLEFLVELRDSIAER